MSKTRIGIVICLFLLLGFAGYFGYEYFDVGNSDKTDEIIDVTNNSNKLLKDKKVTFDNKKNVYLIDDKYEFQKKKGYFIMNIQEDTDGIVYCSFVADYEAGNFDMDADAVYNTCLKTLDGTIDYGVIHVEKQGSNKQLVFNYVEKTKLLSDVVYSFNDKIKLSASEYLISKDAVVISGISSGMSEELNLFNICGSSKNNISNKLEVSLFDKDKNFISSEQIDFIDNKFCVAFENLVMEPNYFSLNYKNS